MNLRSRLDALTKSNSQYQKIDAENKNQQLELNRSNSEYNLKDENNDQKEGHQNPRSKASAFSKTTRHITKYWIIFMLTLLIIITEIVPFVIEYTIMNNILGHLNIAEDSSYLLSLFSANMGVYYSIFYNRINNFAHLRQDTEMETKLTNLLDGSIRNYEVLSHDYIMNNYGSDIYDHSICD